MKLSLMNGLWCLWLIGVWPSPSGAGTDRHTPSPKRISSPPQGPPPSPFASAGRGEDCAEYCGGADSSSRCSSVNPS